MALQKFCEITKKTFVVSKRDSISVYKRLLHNQRVCFHRSLFILIVNNICLKNIMFRKICVRAKTKSRKGIPEAVEFASLTKKIYSKKFQTQD
mmetsp:Transcript_5573/g.8544  ORF Transcript_5573/g.8544 Transcript_5573/m.8544 type:complete len:93 (+) Transcript_5573:254-532(+)